MTVKDRVRALPTPLAAALVALPLVAAALIAFWQTGDTLYPYGDHAIVQGETQRALHGNQLVGTYSRYGWHHPGPALFFWMAPFYALFGHSPAALNGAVAVLNALVLALLVAVVARHAGRTAGFLAAALSLLYVVQAGPTIVRDFWIPHTVMLPFAALIAVTAATAAGSIMLLPLVALLASFLAETDVSVAPASGVVVLAGLVFFVATRGWRALAWTRRVPLMLAGTVAIVAIVWYPPVKQEISGPGPGNLTAIRNFFKQPDPGHTLHDAIASVANSLETIWHGHRDALDAIPAGREAHVFLVVTLLLLVAGVVIALREGRRFPAALCWLSFAAIIAEIYAGTNVRGELFTYLFDWFGATAIVAWTGIACAIVPWLASKRDWPLAWAAPVAAAGAAALLAIWAVTDQATHAGLALRDGAYVNPSMKPIDIAVRNWIDRNRVRDPVIYIPNNDQWPLAAGIYIDRLKRDKPIAIDANWLFVFGPTLAPTGHEDAAIVVADSVAPPKKLEPGARKLVDVNGTVVFANTRPTHKT